MNLSIENYLEITTLYSTYNHLVDMAGDAARLSELFVPDGTYDHGRFGKFEGRVEIAAFMQRAVDEQEAGFQHWTGNLLIDGGGSEASATAYVMTLDARGEQPVIARASIYRDSLVKVDEGWRFVSRRVGYPFSEFRD